MIGSLKRILAAAVLCALSQAPHAEIVIGQTASFTGGPAPAVKEMTTGARLVFDAVNAAGGIRGEKIRLVSRDDGFSPNRAAANAEDLIQKDGAIALFLTRGTPTAEAIAPVIKRLGVPLIAPSTGAMSLHRPVNPLIFNLRSSYQAEAERTIDHLSVMGLGSSIGVIHVDDSFGSDVLEGMMRAFRRNGSKPLFVARFDRNTNDITDALKAASAAHANAVFVVASTEPSVRIVRFLRERTPGTYIATLSTNANDGFVRALGSSAAAGVIVSQVFPRPSDLGIPLVRDAHALVRSSGDPIRVSPALIEGVAAARLLVAALREARAPITSKSLTAALESGVAFDIGWKPVRYSESNHSGPSYTELSIISADGSFRR